MRITQQAMSMQALDRLQTRLRQLAETQSSLGSGRRIHQSSDDPAGMNRAISLRSQQASNQQADRNTGDGLMWTSLADSKLQTLLDRLHRARELAIRAGSVTNAAERDAFAAELSEIREEAVAIANSRVGDRGLFAGHLDGAAVAHDGTNWVYQGDDGAVERRVGEGDVVQVNVIGDEVFGFAAGRDVFTVLDDLTARIQASDSPGIQTSIDEVDDAMDRIMSGLADLGAATNRLEAAQQRGQAEELSLQQRLSEVESVDVAEAIMQLQLEQVAYEATLGALSRSIQPSLIDFLR